MHQTEIDLLNQIAHPVFVLEPDRDGIPRYVAFNDAALLERQQYHDGIIGLTALEAYPGETGHIAFQHHVAVLRSGENRTMEMRVPSPQGMRRIQALLRPVMDAQDKVIRIVGTTKDISGAEIAHEVQANVDAMHEDLAQFINFAAHDLRAPMRHVTQIADMLRQDIRSGKGVTLELIDMLEEVGSKAMSLISDVLSHAEATSTEPTTVAFDFAELVSEIIAVVDPMKRARYAVSSGLVIGDRVATQIVLRNLIENALKHAAAKDHQVRLDISLKQEDTGLYRISVQDNGAGFSDQKVTFLQDGKLRHQSGFGLLGIRKLILARGGTITAGNLPDGKGAQVTVTLPGQVATDITHKRRLFRDSTRKTATG